MPQALFYDRLTTGEMLLAIVYALGSLLYILYRTVILTRNHAVNPEDDHHEPTTQARP